MGITDVRAEMLAFYKQRHSKRGGGGWRALGEMIGVSGSYARELALGEKPLTPDIAAAWLMAVRPRAPRRNVVRVGGATPEQRAARKRLGVPWAWVVEAGLKAFEEDNK
jgi:hypothetical protein